MRGVAALAQDEDEPAGLARLEVDRHVERGAGVEAGAGASRRSASRASAAGRFSEPLRPRNSSRSAVAERSGSLAAAKATRPGNSWL